MFKTKQTISLNTAANNFKEKQPILQYKSEKNTSEKYVPKFVNGAELLPNKGQGKQLINELKTDQQQKSGRQSKSQLNNRVTAAVKPAISFKSNQAFEPRNDARIQRG